MKTFLFFFDHLLALDLTPKSITQAAKPVKKISAR
jgi:hypothetical protein